ncbi:MAG TPA: redoxin domain-containing protein [Planctomycetaceae bacterium]|nr:redoxin domain-containing protein [Planctomycetaceae bacterium]
MQNVTRCCAVFVCVSVLAGMTPQHARGEESEQPAKLNVTMKLLDAQGVIRPLQLLAVEKARVFVFLTGECPISKAYIPTLNRLAEQWNQEPGTIACFGVWADATTPAAKIAAFSKEYDLKFPVLVDRQGELADALGPTHVPEAFVVDEQGKVAYRGRIDDVYTDLDRRRQEATTHDLADAVAAVVAGNAPETARTTPVGCEYQPAPTRTGESNGITYSRDIAPILYASCVMCHRSGEVGPFPLSSYEDAAKRSKQLARVVERRIMPPWLPAETHGEFEDQRTLTDRQMALIKAWSEAGAPEGDAADLPAMPHFEAGWVLGKPDIVLEMQEDFTVPADGPDLFMNFVIPIDIPENKMVAAVDFKAGNPQVVHHSLLYLDNRGLARKRDERHPGPGYSTFGGPGFLPSGSIGGWSPGKTPKRLPDGLGRFLQKGSDLVMQIHYHPNGKPEVDRSKVGVYFVDKPQKAAADLWVSRHDLDIPAGEANYKLSGSHKIREPVTLYGVIPHMHLIGYSMKATAKLPDGTEIPLVDIPRWNFKWQDDYRYSKPISLPAGTEFHVEALYNNSEENLSNPSNPPQRVTFGEGTNDEMMYCFFLVSADTNQNLIKLITDVLINEGISRRKARTRE